jgi:hypothetical protein
MDVYIWSRYHPPMVLCSLSNKILWPHSVEPSSYFRLLNRSLISWLVFCAVQFLWFFAYVLMTSVTYGMLKSLCKVMFDMYQEVSEVFKFVGVPFWLFNAGWFTKRLESVSSLDLLRFVWEFILLRLLLTVRHWCFLSSLRYSCLGRTS